MENVNKLMKDFSDIVDAIEDGEVNQKFLWKQIYANSISDREKAFDCYEGACNAYDNDTERYAMVGDKIANYLKQMEKSNEQLIKLANLVREATKDRPSNNEDDEGFSQDQILDQISKGYNSD